MERGFAGDGARPERGAVWAGYRERLAAFVPRASLAREAVDWLERARGRTWAVACSGGLDSVALVLLAEAWFRPREGSTLLLHFNHGLRGNESDGDAAFVRDLARELDCGFELGVWKEAPSDAGEGAGRRARWGFFNEVCRRRGIDCVLLGHHLDDVAESLLMRVGRGSGTTGLAAPRPVWRAGGGPARVRPLLDLPRSALESAMREAGVPWREDATNESRRHTRNRLRLDVLPAWKAAIPQDWRRAVARTRRLCAEDADALDALAADLGQRAAMESGGLSRAPLRAARRAPARRVLERWVRSLDGLAGVSAAAVEAVVDAVLGTKAAVSVELGRWRVAVDSACVSACVPASGRGGPSPGGAIRTVSTEASFSLPWPGGGVLRGQPVGVTAALIARLERGEVDPRREVFLAVPDLETLVLRPWRAGDRYRPLGAPGTRKLQDAFVDRGVPAALRRRLPVVVSRDGTVLWAPGLLPAECARVLRGRETALRLTYLDGWTPSQ